MNWILLPGNKDKLSVVQLPLYHCQYNPTELIWAQVKSELEEKSSTFKTADTER
jgi:transposase